MEKYIKKNYTVEDYKFSWKRVAKTTGRWASFDGNDLRGWILKINNLKFGKDDCGFLHNTSQNKFHGDDTKQWQVLYYAKGNNIALKKRFDFDDIDGAKQFAMLAFVQIMNLEESEIKDRILQLGRINKEMFV